MLTSWTRTLLGTLAAGLVMACVAGSSHAQVIRMTPSPYQVRPYVGPVFTPFAPAPMVYQYRYNVQTFTPGYPYVGPYGYGYTPPVVGSYNSVIRQAYSPLNPYYQPTVGYYNYSFYSPYAPGLYGPYYP